MLKKIVHLFFIITGGTLGFLYLPLVLELIHFTQYDWLMSPYLSSVVGAIILFILSYFIADYVVGMFKWIEEGLVKIPVVDLLFGAIGLIFGLFVAYLINIPLKDISLKIVSEIIPLFLTVIIGYLGFQVGFRRREEFMGILSLPRKDKVKKQPIDNEKEIKYSIKPKILDTSVIIDGRIADICQTSFLEGTIIIPQFVLEELQHIADSSDALKRNRGRRGLDILNRMQKDRKSVV